MKIINTPIKGCFEIEPTRISTRNIKFIKPYHVDDFKRSHIYFDIAEEYYSISKKNVLRGLHFQTSPHETIKLVSCVRGEIFDAVVDLRKDSETYLKTFSLNLTAEKGNLIYIPKGLAHGFYTLSDEAVVVYICSDIFYADNDFGIRWNSTGINWPVKNPIISEKDANLPPLSELTNNIKHNINNCTL